MTHTFFLAHPDKNVTAILIGLRDGTKRKTVSTGITIRVSSWDKANKTIIKKSEDGVYLARLTRLDADVTKAVKLANASECSLNQLYDEVCMLLGKEDVKENTTDHFLSFYRYWATNSFDRHSANRWTMTTYNIMDSYITNKKITFKEIDYMFYINFLKWLKESRGFKVNTQGTNIKNLKAVMNEAYKRKLHDNRDYLNFVKPSENVDNVYLNMEEYDRLYNLELEGVLCVARDLFLIGCYTGMRVSDYTRLTPNDIRGGFIYFEQKKTKGRIVIPAHRRVIDIIEKYNGSPRLSEAKLNLHIKTICKMAGITGLIGITEGGKIIYKEKYELVSSHTARRSAATNMALNGTPLRDIMQITGHKTESSLLRYIKITDEQNARRLASNPFFL